MSYATRQDLESRFGTDEVAELLATARSDLGGVLADTAAEVDSVLAERYALPLPAATTYPVLVGIACDIARARLYDDEAPERVLGRLSSARKRLRELGAGTRRLVDATGTLVASRVLARRAGPDPVMTREALEGL